MHKILIDLKVDQPLHPEQITCREQLAVLIEWAIALALHGHFELVKSESVVAIPLLENQVDASIAEPTIHYPCRLGFCSGYLQIFLLLAKLCSDTIVT